MEVNHHRYPRMFIVTPWSTCVGWNTTDDRPELPELKDFQHNHLIDSLFPDLTSPEAWMILPKVISTKTQGEDPFNRHKMNCTLQTVTSMI
jgi:hypothetical protein